MKILMLVNWKVKKCTDIPNDLQAPDYIVQNQKYWFFRYFKEAVDIDIIDISSIEFIEKFERNKLHFYIIQTIKAIFKMNKYDVVVSHGMPSGIVLALFRKIYKGKSKHIVFDIGSFNSAAEGGFKLKLNQFASKSIDGIIYHSSKQVEYYERFFPWIINKSKFIHFGTDLEYFKQDINNLLPKEDFILTIGYSMRDIDTLLMSFEKVNTNLKLKIIGNPQIVTKDNRVEILGPIDKRQLNYEIQKAKFCILPLVNKNYSFGQMTLLQQMYYKKIIITAKVPSVMDYIDESTGVFYEPQDLNDLASKISYVINNYEKLNYIGENAYKKVVNMFNEQKMAIEVEKFLNEVINFNE